MQSAYAIGMSFRDGFTLVEIMITITIMAILMAVGTVSISGLQAQARDKERQTDVETIARGLEQYYSNGSSLITNRQTKGSYPGTNVIVAFVHNLGCSPSVYAYCPLDPNDISKLLPGVTLANILPPNTDLKIQTTWFDNDRASVDTHINQFLNEGRYVYHPYDNINGGSCYVDCRGYQLYYREEVTGNTIVIESKHQ